MDKNNYTEGLYINMPSEKAKDFIRVKLGINVNKFINWLSQNEDSRGYVNIDIKYSKNDRNKLYGSVNSFQKKEESEDIPL